MKHRILRQIADITQLCYLFSTIAMAPSLFGQQVDTLGVLHTLALEHQLDSLRQQIRAIESELQTVRLQMMEGSEIDKLLATLTDEDSEDIPEDQRSKRKRVDALLKAITERPGQLQFNGGATSIFQWNPRSSKKFTAGTGSLNIFAHTSVGSTTLLFFDLEAIGGNGPNQHVSTLASLNADAGSTQDTEGVDRLTVNEAWAEFSVLDEALTLTAGKIDLTNYFDNNGVANDETSQFISAAFVNSSALPAPSSTPGFRVRSTLLNLFYVQIGVASVDNSGDNILNELMKIGGVGFKVLPESDYEGNMRVYGYLHPSAENASGYGLSFDQNLLSGLTIFARWNRNGQKIANWFGITSAWSAGGRVITSFHDRRLVGGAAYGETDPANVSLKKEQSLELYLRYHMNKWSRLSTHIQQVWGAGGVPVDVFIVGIRTQFNF